MDVEISNFVEIFSRANNWYSHYGQKGQR